MEYILRTNTVSKKYTNYYAVDKVSISNHQKALLNYLEILFPRLSVIVLVV